MTFAPLRSAPIRFALMRSGRISDSPASTHSTPSPLAWALIYLTQYGSPSYLLPSALAPFFLPLLNSLQIGVYPMLGFKWFGNAGVTINGILHNITTRQGQPTKAVLGIQ